MAATTVCFLLIAASIPACFAGCLYQPINGHVTIPDSVTSIGNSAFHSCSSLTSVSIPNSVTSIGNDVFVSCNSLTSVSIPDSVTSIGNSAFRSCSSLTSVTIPDSVTSISDHAFTHCTSLTSVSIPDSVTSIRRYDFYDCSSLTSVSIPDSVTSIDDFAFHSCSSLTSVSIPDSVTSIGDHAFKFCSSLTSISIPDSVTGIGTGAFGFCSKLGQGPVAISNNPALVIGTVFTECYCDESAYGIGTSMCGECNTCLTDPCTINPSEYAANIGYIYECSDLNITMVPSFSTNPNTPIGKIVWNHTALGALSTTTFTNQSSLKTLWLDTCAIPTIPSTLLVDLIQLVSLSLRNNHLAVLPTGLLTTTIALRVLDLSHNTLTVLPAGLLTTTIVLRVLDLSHNALATMPAGFFDQTPLLESIDLTGNILTYLPPGIFQPTSVHHLLLSSNEFSTAPPNLVQGLPHLQTLNLSHNIISTSMETYLDTASIGLNGNLQILDITDNIMRCTVQTIPSCGTTDSGQYIVSQNPIRCTACAATSGLSFVDSTDATTRDDVSYCGRFHVSPAWAANGTLSHLCGASASTPCYRGDTYQSQAPSMALAAMFVDYSGPADTITYKIQWSNGTLVNTDIVYQVMDGGNTGGFTVNSGNGAMIGITEEVGEYQLQLIAVDASGQSCSVYTWNYTVVERPSTLTIASSWDPTTFATTSFPSTCFVNAPYQSQAPINVPYDGAVGGNEAITYRVSFADGKGNPGFTVDSDTGRIVGIPGDGTEGSYSMALVAADGAGQLVTVKTWEFNVTERPPFAMSTTWGDGSAYVSTDTFDPCYQDDVYTSPAPNMTKAIMFAQYSGDADDISYRLSFYNTANQNVEIAGPGGFTVDSSTGRIVGIPETNGDYTMHLVAIDAEGRTATVYAWTFMVTDRPTFTLSPQWVPSAVLNASFGPSSYINESYQSPAPANIAFIGASGGIQSITYRISFADGKGNPGFTVDSDTGRIVGIPGDGTEGSYSMALVAADGAGQLVTVKTWEFNVTERPPFAMSTTWGDGSAYVSTDTFDPCYQDDVYTSPAPNMTKAIMFAQYSGDADDISYRLSFYNTANQNVEIAGPGGFTVDSSTGRIVGIPETNGDYTMHLVAIDAEGRTATVYAWTFTVTDRPTFIVKDGIDFTYAPSLRSKLTVNESYRFTSPVNLTNKASFFEGQLGTVNFLLEVTGGQIASGDILIETDTGLIQASPTTTYCANLTLVAVDSARRQINVLTWEIATLSADTVDASNGPNEAGCGEGTPVDAIEYDGNFTCSCPSSFIGENCEIPLNVVIVCEFGEVDSLTGTQCIVSPSECPPSCTCTATTPVGGAINNHIDVTCTAVPIDAFPEGTRNIDLTDANITSLAQLSVLKVPITFANDGALLLSPLPPTTPVEPSQSGGGSQALASISSQQGRCPVDNNRTDLPITICDTPGTCTNAITCDLGAFQSEDGSTCTKCARGGFYSDRAGRVGPYSHCPSACNTCTRGTFANVSGADTLAQCKVCPTGTQTDDYAGYRACRCLPGFARTDRFGACSPCTDRDGIVCNAEYEDLLPGFYWKFQTDENALEYVQFVANLQREYDYNTSLTRFSASLPQTYTCPRAESCRGGLQSECASGYAGPLCATCANDYTSTFGECRKCSDTWVNLIVLLIVISLLLYILFRLWVLPVMRATDDDVVVGVCWEIFEDHYVIVSQTLTIYAFVPWTNINIRFLSLVQYISEPFAAGYGMGCLANFTAQDDLVVFAALPLAWAFLVSVMKIAGRISSWQQVIGILLKSLPTLLVYTVEKAVVVLRPCTEVAGVEYMTNDFNVVCDATHTKFRVLAGTTLATVLSVVVGTFSHMKLHRQSRYWKDVYRILTSYYSDQYWYWRFVDFARLVCLTSLVQFITPDTSVQIFIAALASIGFLQLQYWASAILYTQPGAKANNRAYYNYALVSVLLVLFLTAMLNCGVADEGVDTHSLEVFISIALILAVLLPYLRLVIVSWFDKHGSDEKSSLGSQDPDKNSIASLFNRHAVDNPLYGKEISSGGSAPTIGHYYHESNDVNTSSAPSIDDSDAYVNVSGVDLDASEEGFGFPEPLAI